MNATASEPGRRPRFAASAGRASSGRLASLLYSGRVPAGLIALAVAIMLYGLLASNEYTVQRIVIDGVTIGDANQVAVTADVLDESIFLVNPEAVAERLLTLPYVAGVDVQVRLPGEVAVTVVEHEPVLVVAVSGSAFAVDAYGVVLGPAREAQLPLVTLRQAALAPGERLDAELVAALLAVAAAHADPSAELVWQATQGITLRLADKREIIFGGPARMPEKLTVLEAILSELDPNWSVLDLTEPDRPYTV